MVSYTTGATALLSLATVVTTTTAINSVGRPKNTIHRKLDGTEIKTDVTCEQKWKGTPQVCVDVCVEVTSTFVNGELNSEVSEVYHDKCPEIAATARYGGSGGHSGGGKLDKNDAWSSSSSSSKDGWKCTPETKWSSPSKDTWSSSNGHSVDSSSSSGKSGKSGGRRMLLLAEEPSSSKLRGGANNNRNLNKIEWWGAPSSKPGSHSGGSSSSSGKSGKSGSNGGSSSGWGPSSSGSWSTSSESTSSPSSESTSSPTICTWSSSSSSWDGGSKPAPKPHGGWSKPTPKPHGGWSKPTTPKPTTPKPTTPKPTTPKPTTAKPTTDKPTTTEPTKQPVSATTATTGDSVDVEEVECEDLMWAVDVSGTCTNEPDVVNADVAFVSARECCEEGLGLGGEGTCPFDDICFTSTPAPTPGATEGSTPTVSKAVTTDPTMNNAGRGDSRN